MAWYGAGEGRRGSGERTRRSDVAESSGMGRQTPRTQLGARDPHVVERTRVHRTTFCVGGSELRTFNSIWVTATTASPLLTHRAIANFSLPVRLRRQPLLPPISPEETVNGVCLVWT